MKLPVQCRRKHPRFRLLDDPDAVVEFGFPTPRGTQCRMQARDFSASGLSFLLAHDLPGLEEGQCLNRARITVGTWRLDADLLIMHLTPDNRKGSVCGVLIYPMDDEGILALQGMVKDFSHRGLPQEK